MREVEQHLILLNVRIDHVTIQSELQYVSGAKVAETVKWVCGPGSPSPKTLGLSPVQLTTPPRRGGMGLWTVLGPNRTVYPDQSRTAGGLHRAVANAMNIWGKCFIVLSFLISIDLKLQLITPPQITWWLNELQSTLEASGIEWPALRNHIPCMGRIIQLALGALMRSLGVKGRTRPWEAHGRTRQFGKNESIDIGQSQRLQKVGNARINKVSAMRQGLAKIIEKVHISTYFESPETDLHTAENACCIDYADTWSSKQVHSLFQRHSVNSSTTCCGFEDTVVFDTGVASACPLFTRIHLSVAQESNIQRLLVTRDKTGWMDHHECYAFGVTGILPQSFRITG